MAHILGTSADYLTGRTDNPAPNYHYIFKEEKPELFSLIEKAKNCDSDTQKKISGLFPNAFHSKRIVIFIFKLFVAEHEKKSHF